VSNKLHGNLLIPHYLKIRSILCPFNRKCSVSFWEGSFFLGGRYLTQIPSAISGNIIHW
jgi:hypothetical protein